MNIIEPIWVACVCCSEEISATWHSCGFCGLPCRIHGVKRLTQDTLQTLVDAMPRRVASLLCARVDLVILDRCTSFLALPVYFLLETKLDYFFFSSLTILPYCGFRYKKP
ncbi:hypothetical protein AVEN_79701-1 [Araneus ventricosus]|uniref:Uncharacterized protein n=1 Tax=Araneus ventricosus TaxID=182803 RepID=A0A4Y1ZRI8_ARAVE|nr:hypothetical protein AVEN_79701-1 [Araneus ventricosus]